MPVVAEPAEICRYTPKSILLLGPKASGKYTFLKQLQFLYGDEFDVEYKIALIPHIHKQTIEEIKLIVKQCDTNLFSEEAKSAATYITIFDYDTESTDKDQDSLIKSARILCKEPLIRFMQSFGEQNESSYFLSHIDRIIEENYFPNDQDIVNVSVDDPNLKLKELEFNIEIKDRKYNIDIINPSLTSSNWDECKKRLNEKSTFDLIIFIASLTCYDDGYINDADLLLLLYGFVGVYYDRDKVPDELISLIKQFYDDRILFNAMTEQLKMYNDISGSNILILFLNKYDILESKLNHKPIMNVFPGFEDYFFATYEEFGKDATSSKQVSEHIMKLICGEFPRNQEYYYSCMTDQHDVKTVFEKVLSSLR